MFSGLIRLFLGPYSLFLSADSLLIGILCLSQRFFRTLPGFS